MLLWSWLLFSFLIPQAKVDSKDFFNVQQVVLSPRDHLGILGQT